MPNSHPRRPCTSKKRKYKNQNGRQLHRRVYIVVVDAGAAMADFGDIHSTVFCPRTPRHVRAQTEDTTNPCSFETRKLLELIVHKKTQRRMYHSCTWCHAEPNRTHQASLIRSLDVKRTENKPRGEGNHSIKSQDFMTFRPRFGFSLPLLAHQGLGNLVAYYSSGACASVHTRESREFMYCLDSWYLLVN